MSRIISILIVALALWGGWHLFQYWEQFKTGKGVEQRRAVANTVDGDQLAGLPKELEASLHMACDRGARGMRDWLRAYGNMVRDPRKAWIELDYCIVLSRDDPAEARRIFAEVRKRTPPSSPVYHRIQELAKAFE